MLRSCKPFLRLTSVPVARYNHSSLSSTSSPTPVFLNSVRDGPIPAFRLLGSEGSLLDSTNEWGKKAMEIDGEKLQKMLRVCTLLPQLDQILFSSQRQGRISFYMTSYGEEGAVVGSAAAWENDDEVFAQYREVGVLLWRDYPLSSLMSQVFASKSDTATLGRQMPVHYGSKEYHFHTISSPLGTQLPQAAGAAYALKRTPGRENSCVICYVGEGATSEGDFHAALNMASVLGGPLVFFVRVRLLHRLSCFAISTPVCQQYAGDGIAARGPGYGIDTVRVDGNDPLAVYLVCKEARRRAVEGKKPVLVEALSYRVSHHSTSDDSTAYRSVDEVNAKKLDSPIFRMRKYLESLSPPLWSKKMEDEVKDAGKREILREFSKAEKEKKPALEHMFGDVFAKLEGERAEEEGGELERPQREQKQELRRLVEKWGEADTWKKELEKFDGGREAVLKW
ncbi:hypothetical protein JCM8547_004626 [Rhodosporidiobolus lusitaniae]